MLNRLTPFYQVDGAAGWDGFFDQPDETAPVVDEQPEADSETETVEETETEESEEQPEETAGDSEEEQPEAEQSAFNDETEIDLGEGRQPVKLSELKAGFLRQSDYTKKTQALADERKTFESERVEWEPVKGLNDFLTANPWLSQQINSFVQEFQQTGTIPIEEVLADAQYGQYVNHLMGQVNTLQKQLDSLTGEHEGLKLTTDMARLQTDLKAEYGDLVTDEYMNTLQERSKAEKLPTSVMRELAEAHLAKQKLQQTQNQSKKATKEAEARTFQKISEKRTTLPSQPRKTGQVPSSGKDTNPYEPVGWGDVFS